MRMVLRLPYEKEFLFLENGENGEQGVSFISFDAKHTRNLYSAEGLQKVSLQDIKKEIFSVQNFPTLDGQFSTPTEVQYLRKIEAAKLFIIENQLPKIVISRPVLKEVQDVKLAETFFNICQKYDNALCYIFISNSEIWMGATPEILGQFNRNTSEFKTISLAGTLPLKEEWTDKEMMEQSTVTHYIKGILEKYSKRVHLSEPYNHFSRNIKHLRTDFSAIINEKHLENLIRELHPTPAVCGIPKDLCQRKILELEQYDREFYTGYIRFEIDDVIYYFVNLRCAKFYEKAIVAFAGGGITPDSVPQKEWRETELKSEVILRSLA